MPIHEMLYDDATLGTTEVPTGRDDAGGTKDAGAGAETGDGAEATTGDFTGAFTGALAGAANVECDMVPSGS